MLKKKLENVIDLLKKAELQEDGSIKVTIKYDIAERTVNFGNFRCFCDELIRKLLTG